LNGAGKGTDDTCKRGPLGVGEKHGHCIGRNTRKPLACSVVGEIGGWWVAFYRAIMVCSVGRARGEDECGGAGPSHHLASQKKNDAKKDKIGGGGRGGEPLKGRGVRDTDEVEISH